MYCLDLIGVGSNALSVYYVYFRFINILLTVSKFSTNFCHITHINVK